MRKLLFIIAMVAVNRAAAQSPIDRIEYFFNSDPGYGNATAANISSAINIADFNFSPNISSLNPGPNMFYVRSRTSSGIWSQTNSYFFYKLTPLSPGASLNRIEYYFNTDPGFGAGTNVLFTPDINLSDVSFTPDITSLQQGINQLYVRSRDANGKWSQVASWMFYRTVLPAPSFITQIEYYFNADPGIGMGIQVPFTAGNNIADLNFTPDISGLPAGVNQLYIRSKNALGKWSQLTNSMVYKMIPKSVISPITKMEYFINTDPGLGNAIPVVFTRSDSIPDFAFSINIAGLPAGMHFMYTRTRDSIGKWSITGIDTIQITTPMLAQAIIINSLLINPPGTGLGNTVTTLATLCAGKEIRLAFDPSGSYNAGNVFTIQLSDENGTFGNPYSIGVVNAVKGAATICTLPRHLNPGTNYRIRVVSSNPVVTGDPSQDNLTINDINLGQDTTLYHSCFGETSNLLPLYNTSGLVASWNTPTPQVVGPGTYRLIGNNSTGCPDTAFAIVNLEVASWMGTTSSDWHTAANWNIGKVPTEKTHVIVSSGTPNACIISSGNAAAASVQARNGATVQIINNRGLIINGKCTSLPPN